MSDLAALDQSLRLHEKRSQDRHDNLANLIKETAMTTGTDHVKIENIMKPDGGMGLAALAPLMAGGGGLGGGGLLAGVVLGSLLNRRGGLFGGEGGEVGGVVTPALLASSLAQVTETQQNTTVLQSLGDIKASVPLAEAQVQLALAGAQSELSSQITANSLATQGAISAATASVIAAEGATKETVLISGNQLLGAIKDAATLSERNTWAITQAISNDGEKTRALLVAQNEATLNRQLAVAEAALLEARGAARTREVEVNVSQSVAQNQNQIQAQTQAQQQLILLSQIANGLGNLTQIAHATNSNIIAGNTGAVTTGTQTASPVNVRA